MTEENDYFFNCLQKGELPDLSLFRDQFYHPSFDGKQILQSVKKEANFDENASCLTDILIIDLACNYVSKALKPIMDSFPEPNKLFQSLSVATTSMCTDAIPIVLDIVKDFTEYTFISKIQKWSTLGTDKEISLPYEFSVRYETLPVLLLPIAVAFRIEKGQETEKILSTLKTYSTQIFDILECFNKNAPGLFPNTKRWSHIRNSDLHSNTTYDSTTDTYTFRDRNKNDLDMTRFELVLMGIHINEGYKVMLSYNHTVLLPWFISIYAKELGNSPYVMAQAERFEADMKKISLILNDNKRLMGEST